MSTHGPSDTRFIISYGIVLHAKVGKCARMIRGHLHEAVQLFHPIPIIGRISDDHFSLRAFDAEQGHKPAAPSRREYGKNLSFLRTNSFLAIPINVIQSSVRLSIMMRGPIGSLGDDRGVAAVASESLNPGAGMAVRVGSPNGPSGRRVPGAFPTGSQQMFLSEIDESGVSSGQRGLLHLLIGPRKIPPVAIPLRIKKPFLVPSPAAQ